ncbi:N-acetyltransferase family protein [Silvibacterium acidisoli]|uniref:N-acetyltransferase family protein n=1 Tax=Acidobacteriaceae bacterium ZG23-2 TaxID=2883246 RepID=UPI00406C0412
MIIRPAMEADMPEITEIYNDVIRTSTAIYRDDPATLEERVQWFRVQQEKGYAVIVAEEEGDITGFASYGDFRAWPGYRFTVEGTIHLGEKSRRQGTGTQLLDALTAHARAAGKHVLMAGVDSENVASRRFLEKHGAEQTGHLKEVGYKFGRYLDLVFYQFRLSSPE